MQDAVILANCLFDTPDKSKKSVEACFQSYYRQRYEHAKVNYDASLVLSKVMCGLTWKDRLIRTIMLKYVPESFHLKQFAKAAGYR